MAYLRNPALSEETYKHLIDYGLENHTLRIVTVTIPVRFLPAVMGHVHERHYAVITLASKNKNYARLTVYVPAESRGKVPPHENSSSL